MTDTQWLSLALIGAVAFSTLWTIFVLIPGYLWTVLTVRLRDVHRQMAKLFVDDPRLESIDELQEMDIFLHNAIGNRTHFGLSGALTTLVGSAFLRLDADDDNPFDEMSYTERVAVASLVSDAMRLTFLRAFLGSSLWFLTWPLAIWAVLRFSRIGATDEDWSATARIVPLESMRERASGGWPPLAGVGSHGRHQTAG